jgi:hypothetical protein
MNRRLISLPQARAFLQRPAARAGLVLLALATIAAVFFGDGLFGDTRSLIWDSADQQLAYLNLASRLWRSGQLPVWNPFLFNGYPMIAEPVYQIFYLPNLLLSLATAFSPRAVLFQLAVHQLMGGFFTYLLAGLWLKSTPARLLAGVVYMLNGVFWARQEHVVTIDTEIWLPLVLYAVERAWRARTPSSLALAAGSIALLLLAGHPQSFYFSLLVVGLTTVFWVADARAADAGPAWRPPAVLAAVVGLGVLLASVQLLPTAELMRLTNRGAAIPYKLAIASGALRPSHLVTALLPDFHGALRGPYLGEGDVSQSSIYFGVVPLLLVGFALAGRLGRRGVYLLLMALFALLVSLGPSGFVSSIAYRVIPLFAMFRSPANYAFAFVLFAALLAGHGLEQLERDEVRPARYVAYLAALGLALWLLIHFEAPPNPRLAANLHRDTIRLAAGIGAVVLLLALRRTGVLGASACGWLAVASTTVELVIAGAGANTLGDRAPASVYCEESPAPLVAAVGGLPGQACTRPDPPVVDEGHAASAYRLHVDSQVYRDGSPLPNILPLYRVGFDRIVLHQGYLTDGYEPMVLRRHVAFHRLVQRLSLETAGLPPAQRAAVIGRPLLAAGVRYLYLSTGLVELPDPLPRAYFVERARTATDDADALRLLGDPTVDLRSEVILERDGPDDAPARRRRWEPVRFVSQTAANVSLHVEAPRAGYVVLSDTFYPGWEATVNGRAAPVLRANQSFKAVQVEAGPNDVRFRFRPRSLRWGAILSLLTLLLGGGILAVRFRRREGK